MERLRPIAVLAAALAGGGCVTTKTEAPPAASAAKTPDVPPPSLALPSLPGIPALGPPAEKKTATQMAVMWQQKPAYLPDPTQNGQMFPGLAGQLLLFTASGTFAPADGTLTVDLYDETPRAAGASPGPLMPERWQFDREAMRKLASADERFGKSYVIFLPWRAYRPDVTRVRLAARFDPSDGGHPLFAASQTMTLDTTTGAGTPVWSNSTSVVTTRPPAATPGAPPPAFPAAPLAGPGAAPVPFPPAPTPGPGTNPTAFPAAPLSAAPLSAAPLPQPAAPPPAPAGPAAQGPPPGFGPIVITRTPPAGK